LTAKVAIFQEWLLKCVIMSCRPPDVMSVAWIVYIFPHITYDSMSWSLKGN
jgi:hypothetical protein